MLFWGGVGWGRGRNGEGEGGGGGGGGGGVKGGRGSARNQCELVFGLRKEREIH